MATYGEIQDNIARVLSRSDLTTSIQDAILKAIRFYEDEPLWFIEDTFTKTLSASQSNYTLTGSLSLITSFLNIKVANSGTTTEVRPTIYQELERIDMQASTGEPSIYARWNNQIRLYPTPDNAYTLTVRAYRKFVTLSATTDSNAWTQYADELIEARATWWVATTKMRNYDLAAAAKSIETSALSKLRGRSTNYTASGKTKPTEF